MTCASGGYFLIDAWKDPETALGIGTACSHSPIVLSISGKAIPTTIEAIHIMAEDDNAISPGVSLRGLKRLLPYRRIRASRSQL
jgi:hypothetical protein